MVLLIAGASHTGKTLLAQRLLERYNYYRDILSNANAIETRLDESACTMESLLRGNAETLRQCRRHGVDCVVIDEQYPPDPGF